LGGEIKKVAGSGKGRVRRDKHSPPLETMPRQKASVLIGFQTCNKTYTAVGMSGIRKQAGRGQVDSVSLRGGEFGTQLSIGHSRTGTNCQTDKNERKAPSWNKNLLKMLF
jgi:hypothetical protein